MTTAHSKDLRYLDVLVSRALIAGMSWDEAIRHAEAAPGWDRPGRKSWDEWEKEATDA